MAMVTIRLPQELRDRIDKLSERSGRTKSYFIRQLVERGVDALEEEQRELEEIRAAIRSGRRGFKTYSMDEVLEHVGLTRMDIGMDPERGQPTKETRQPSSAKGPKKAGVAKPKPTTNRVSKAPKKQ
ncbi:MAG: ribbon-helix-helix protein, CopG family [Actinobacteria bacterium]|nr:ribbon-helix-helix protein, CopG family [Actinomycetota bacterium]